MRGLVSGGRLAGRCGNRVVVELEQVLGVDEPVEVEETWTSTRLFLPVSDLAILELVVRASCPQLASG